MTSIQNQLDSEFHFTSNEEQNQLYSHDNNDIDLLDENLNDTNDCSLSEKLQIFDPIHNKEKPNKIMSRLPTPKKPTLNRQASSTDQCHKNNIQENTNNNKPHTASVQLDPTPPTSPGKRVRHSSIARLVKIPTREKLNNDLAEFDPLLKKNDTDLLILSSNKKGAQTVEQSIGDSISTKLSNNTRIPLPIQQNNRLSTINTNLKDCEKQKLQHKLELKLEHKQTPKHEQKIEHNQEHKQEQKIESKQEHEQEQKIEPKQEHKQEVHQINQEKSTNIKEDHPSKLKRPEVRVPESIKKLPSYRHSTTNAFQDHLFSKERENSRRLSANLISAHGVMSLQSEPQALSPVHNTRFEKIHGRLQCLVDVHVPVENDYQNIDTPRPEKIQDDNPDAMNPRDALEKYRNNLSPYERTEILRYPNVYFVGEQAKKIMATTDETQQNYGYDDEKGDYQIKTKDHMNYRYEILESLGKGSFGQVLKCRDHKTYKSDPDNSTVAVKIIRNKKRFQAQAQTEVKILEQLVKWDPKNKHYNVRMMDSFYFRNHLCIVFECLSLNLYDILQQNGFQGFSMGLVKRFAYQILTALKLLGEHNVIHCDLKPENILLKKPDRSGIRVIDYGSSCYANEKVFTYIQSRFYRAPEVILGLDYGLPIDMWSTGCILAELYTGHPLFPGENEPDQLACIMQVLGTPKKEYLDRCTRKKQFFDSNDYPRKSSNSKGKKRKPNSIPFEDILKRSNYDNCDKDFVDFISKCITWDPEKRIKPRDALNHPWIQAVKKT